MSGSGSGLDGSFWEDGASSTEGRRAATPANLGDTAAFMSAAMSLPARPGESSPSAIEESSSPVSPADAGQGYEFAYAAGGQVVASEPAISPAPAEPAIDYNAYLAKLVERTRARQADPYGDYGLAGETYGTSSAYGVQAGYGAASSYAGAAAYPEASAYVDATAYAPVAGYAAAPAYAAAESSSLGDPVASASASGAKNPLVAAREAGIGPSETSPNPAAPKPADALYPLGDGSDESSGRRSKQGKEFDTSFGEKRRGGGVALVIVIIILLLVAAAAAAYFVLRGQARSSADELIASAAEHISSADELVGPLSAGIASELESGVASEAVTNAMMSSTTATSALTLASDDLDEAAAVDWALTDEQRDAVSAGRSSVSGRRAILDVGSSLMSTDSAASKAVTSLDAAFASIAAANDKATQSVNDFTTYVTSEDPASSGIDLWNCVTLDNEAVNDIVSAQASVAQAKADYPGVDYTGLENYLAARLTELQLLAQYDSLYVSGDTEGAAGVEEQYNAARDAAGVAAGGTAWDSWSVIGASYAASVESQRAKYEEGVTTCMSGDEGLAAFLDEGAPSLADASAGTGEADAAASTDVQVAEEAAQQEDVILDEGVVSGEATGQEASVEG